MAKRFLLASEKLDALLSDLKENLKSKKRVYEPISLSITPEVVNKRALLIFSSKAYIKTRSLIDLFSTEIEWHGFVKRVNETTFFVEDIVVFPHEVTAATVTSNQEEYDEFFESLTEEQQANFKFHGHSHVNMDTSPSFLDISKQKDVVNNLGIPRPGSQEDLFYIFFIGNKRNDSNVKIYDVTNDVIYERQDITIDIQIDGDETAFGYANEARKLITEPPFYGYASRFPEAKESRTNFQGKGTPKPTNKVKQQSIYDDPEEDEFYQGNYPRKHQ